MGQLDNLGAALRHLHLHGAAAPRKQLDIAARAGVTRATLSSYERGKQNPSVDNLDKVLGALDADLVQLQWALDIVGEAPRATGGPAASATPGADALYPLPRADLLEVREGPPDRRSVPLPGPVDEDEEEALAHLIDGFLAWVRYTRRLKAAQEGEEDEEPPGPANA